MKMNALTDARALVMKYGADILASPGMQRSRAFMQHGDVSVYRHSLAVALMCVAIARRLRVKVNERSLVRGALLHDYFLYDWHDPDPSHKWHGFRHPATALRNARRDFALTPVEENMIQTHMFPMVPKPPRCRESAILCLADKLVAAREVIAGRRQRHDR